MPNLLLVDDQPNRASTWLNELTALKFEVEHKQSNQDIKAALVDTQVDILLLRLALSRLDGLAICREVRPVFQGFIVILAEYADEIDEVVSLEMGADEYLAEPISHRKLLARLANLQRRQKSLARLDSKFTTTATNLALSVGLLSLNKLNNSCSYNQIEVPLAYGEFQVLYYLASHSDRLVSREELLQNTRGIEYDGFDRSIDVSIARLRKHFAHLLDTSAAIVTVRAKGYMLVSLNWQ